MSVLQWGHGERAVERPEGADLLGIFRDAAMGPRRESRGEGWPTPRSAGSCCCNGATAREPWRAILTVGPFFPLTLQWGHGERAVESSSYGSASGPSPTRCNGATAREPWRGRWRPAQQLVAPFRGGPGRRDAHPRPQYPYSPIANVKVRSEPLAVRAGQHYEYMPNPNAVDRREVGGLPRQSLGNGPPRDALEVTPTRALATSARSRAQHNESHVWGLQRDRSTAGTRTRSPDQGRDTETSTRSWPSDGMRRERHQQNESGSCCPGPCRSA